MTLPILLAVLVTNIAPDGVNTIITDTETGVTQSTLAYVWPRPECSDINVGVVPDEFLQGLPQTVLIPGADKSYVVMSEAWYADITNRVAKNEKEIAIIRAEKEKTEEGRVLYHGPRVSVHVDSNQMKRFLVYDDGFIYTENFAPRKDNTPTGFSASATSNTKRSTNPRYEAALKRREAAKKPVEKTIIHMGGAR